MKKWMLAVACFTLADIQNADKNGECRSDCKHMGYVSGAYFQDTEKCWCATPLQLQLPNKINKIKSYSVTVPYINSAEDMKLPWE